MTTDTKSSLHLRIISGCLLTLTAIAVATALHELKSVMLPFVLAVFLTYLVSPVVDLAETRLRVPRFAALALTFLVTLLLCGSFLLLALGNIGEMLQGADEYKVKILALLDDVLAGAAAFGVRVDKFAVQQAVQRLPVFTLVRSAAGQVANVLTSGMFVLIFLMFLMTGSRPASRRLGVYGEIDSKIRRYIATKLGLSAATAVLTWFILVLAGVDLAFLLSVATFLLNFIPTIGSIIAVALPIPVLVLQYESVVAIVAVLGALGAAQFVIGNIIEPKLMGQSLDLHPATILLSLTLWGVIWGPMGMVLSVPIMASLKIALGRIEATRGIAELMAGRLPRG